jgi:hypothetical protein
MQIAATPTEAHTILAATRAVAAAGSALTDADRASIVAGLTRSTRLPARPRARSIHRSSGTP